MAQPTQLTGVTWNHTRGFTPMVATAQRFSELHPGVEIHWKKRSLGEFADQPIGELAERYDLLVIDHPWAGFAAASGVLTALDEHLPADFLTDQAANSVGRSHESYQAGGHQWALAIDAACPVSAYRPDLLDAAGEKLPNTFDELIALGRKGLVCCPSIPLDTYGNFLNLLTAAGETIFPSNEEVADPAAGVTALERLRELASVTPDEFFELNPIRTLERMSQEDAFAYCPYTYGYTNYSRPGYAPRLVKFGDVIGVGDHGPGATMLGGTGLAVSSKCKHLDVAMAYAEFVAAPAMQRGLSFECGGQPGHRSAWVDAGLNAACSDFFTDTLPTLDRAFIRPRYAGYLDFQDAAGEVIHAYLHGSGTADATLTKLNELYRDSQPPAGG